MDEPVIDDSAVDAALLQFNAALTDAGVDDAVVVLAYVAGNGLAAAMSGGVTPTDREGCSGLWAAAMSEAAMRAGIALPDDFPAPLQPN